MTFATSMQRTSQASSPSPAARPQWRALFPAVLVCVLLFSAAFRVFMFMSGRLPFDMDQAVPGIGALRILRVGKFCIVWPGQNYAADIFPLYYAPLHLIFPPSVALMRLGMIPVVALLGLATCYGVLRTFGTRTAALVSMTLMLFAPSMAFDKLGSPAFLSTLPLAMLGIAMPWFFGLWKNVDQEGWSRNAATRALALGVLLGLAYWFYPLTVIYAGAMAASLVLYPRSAMRFCGLAENAGSGISVQTRPWLRAAFQALFLILLALATWILITGPGQGAAPRSAFEFRHLVLLAAVVSAAVRLWTSIPVGGRGRWSDLGAAAGLFGYCIGASPIIYMNWVLSEPVFVGSELVTSVSRILRQFSAIVHTGLPILLGWYHNWAQPVRTVPVLLRATVVAVAVASLVWLLLSALNARRRDLPSGPPLAFLVLLFAIQVIAFSASKSGRLASEPRYLVTLYWIVCLSAGLLADRIWRASRPLKPGAVALVGVVVVANMWSCVDAPRQKIVRWSGEEQSLRTLIDDLESHGLNRVSGRFCRYGYLCSYMISYVSDERVLAAPAGDPNGTNIRSERYQREVDEAPELAYFVMDADLPFIEDYLRRCMVDYEVLRSDNFRTIHDVYPDVLHGIGANDIPGLVEAAR